MSVSAVFLSTVALRSLLRMVSAMSAQLIGPTCRPRAPRLAASCKSVSRSPMTQEPARSYEPSRYFPNIPIPGLRQGELSSGKDGSIRMSSNTTPSPSRVFRRMFWAGQKVSSGKAGVPSPSWLEAMTSSYPRPVRAFMPEMAPGTNSTLSRESICSSAGSLSRVPSRSTKITLFIGSKGF